MGAMKKFLRSIRRSNKVEKVYQESALGIVLGSLLICKIAIGKEV